MQGEAGKGRPWFSDQPFFYGINIGNQENNRAVTAEMFHVFRIADDPAPGADDHIRRRERGDNLAFDTAEAFLTIIVENVGYRPPVLVSMRSSVSIKGIFSREARILPISVFPTPRKPVNTILLTASPRQGYPRIPGRICSRIQHL